MHKPVYTEYKYIVNINEGMGLYWKIDSSSVFSCCYNLAITLFCIHHVDSSTLTNCSENIRVLVLGHLAQGCFQILLLVSVLHYVNLNRTPAVHVYMQCTQSQSTLTSRLASPPHHGGLPTGSWSNVEQAIVKLTEGIGSVTNQTLKSKLEESVSLVKG